MIKLLRTSLNARYGHGPRALHITSKYPIDVSPEVQHALQSRPRRPVVALESALVTHGLPSSINFQTALSIESKVRSVGAIPATIGLLDGRIIVGLATAQLERLADIKDNLNLVKVSRRDLASAVGLGRSGGTTISGTSVIANLMGIHVFATGGLGGVHRGGATSWDVSADLTELGRTPIAVISAGVKSILDIPKTLEYLETQGVAVFTYGLTNDFPGFFSPVTGHKSPWRVNSPHSAARIIHASQRLGLNSGMLFAAPIPEEYAEASIFIQDAVDAAVKESETNGMSKRGKDVTPWLLARVAELTQGRSIPSNIALLENTATIGGEIAVEFAKLANGVDEQHTIFHSTEGNHSAKESDAKNTIIAESRNSPTSASLLVIGAAAVDITSQPDQDSHSGATLSFQSTTTGKVSISPGGVARNIAEAAHRILSTSDGLRRHSVLLISPLGNDLFADLIREDARRLGMRTDGFLDKPNPDQRTAVCNMHVDASGNLVTGVADMSIVNTIDAHPIIKIIENHHPEVVSFDANLNSHTLAALMRCCRKRSLPTFFDPTSVSKSSVILNALQQSDMEFHSAPVKFASPNLLELSHIYQEFQSSPQELMNKPQWWSAVDGLGLGEQYRTDLASLSRQPISTSTDETLSFLINGVAQMAVSLLPFFQHLFIKCGEKGILVAMRVVGEAALHGGWTVECTRPESHQVVAKGRNSILVLKHYPAVPLHKEDIVNVTGAGDSFVGTLLAGLIQPYILDSPRSMDKLVKRAQHAAALSLRSRDAVSSVLTNDKVNAM